MHQNNLLKERDRGGQTGSAAGDTTRTAGHERILQSRVGMCAGSAEASFYCLCKIFLGSIV